MRRLEPPIEQALAGVRRARVSAVAELLHLAAQRRHQRRHELFHAAFPQRLIGGKPANARIENRVRGLRKVWVQGHYFFPPFFPTLTSTIVIVSLPKMSTTFTAIFRRPGSHSWKTLFNSSDRSFFVRKLCHSFSKM